jgi:hypothetical protein
LAYLYSSADGVEGQLDDQGEAFCEGGEEEGEDEFQLLFIGECIDELRCFMHEKFVDVDVDDGGHEGVRQSESDSSVKRPFLPLERLQQVPGGAHVYLLLAALEPR